MRKILLLAGCFSFLSVSFAALQFTAASKSTAMIRGSVRDNLVPVTGIWTGVYTTDQVDHEPKAVTFMILPDGVFFKRCKVVGKNSEYSLSKGSWKLDGNVFQYTDTAVLYSGGTVINTGTANLSEGELRNFTWKDLSVQIYTGKFLHVKKISSEITGDFPNCATSP